MSNPNPLTKLDTRFSGPGATATTWEEAQAGLEAAQIYWISTVRPDGRPHVTPLIAVWLDGSLYFTTGPLERKAQNLAANVHCVLTTGTNAYDHGLDLVVEGDAERVRDAETLQRIADSFESKYGIDWHFDVRDDAFAGGDGGTGESWVFEVAPLTAFGFGRGDVGSQTRWRFEPE